ncbi:hypothetical protein T492DRAFT_884233, partial [Pavlovales sp. CCMP2436]
LKATITRIDLAQAPTCQLAGRPEMCASCKVQAVRADHGPTGRTCPVDDCPVHVVNKAVLRRHLMTAHPDKVRS